MRIEWTGSGAGEYLAVVADERDRVINEFRGTLEEVKAWMRAHYPDLPAKFVPMMKNPAYDAAGNGHARRKETHQVTDRALRYRANRHPPEGERICALCGSRRNVEVGHVNGNEADCSAANLFWTCRACNVRSGNTLRRAGIGRRTKQYNPAAAGEGARNLGEWLNAVMSMKGDPGGNMPVTDAVALIRATPPDQRSRFAKEIWRRRRQHYGSTGRSDAPPF